MVMTVQTRGRKGKESAKLTAKCSTAPASAWTHWMFRMLAVKGRSQGKSQRQLIFSAASTVKRRKRRKRKKGRGRGGERQRWKKKEKKGGR